eukprot:GCRY01001039.1.p1 GENE.GCRY01001039.1~~GCRY01001039.1.p1  ORF type:complete len:287 (+),score=76.83 GCRY01001039.1:199-1059(+)
MSSDDVTSQQLQALMQSEDFQKFMAEKKANETKKPGLRKRLMQKVIRKKVKEEKIEFGIDEELHRAFKDVDELQKTKEQLESRIEEVIAVKKNKKDKKKKTDDDEKSELKLELEKVKKQLEEAQKKLDEAQKSAENVENVEEEEKEIKPAKVASPIPPPPPMPTSPLVHKITPLKKRKASFEAENTTPRKSPKTSSSATPSNVVSEIVELFKCTGTPKLKRVDVEKSPGGTPQRRRKSVTEGDSPCSLMARAIKEKFGTISENDSEEEADDYSEDDDEQVNLEGSD